MMDAADGVHDIGARLAPNVEDDGWFLLMPGADALVLEAIRDMCHVAQQDWSAVAIGDGDERVVSSAGYLVVGRNGMGLRLAVQGPFGRGDIGSGHGRTQVL